MKNRILFLFCAFLPACATVGTFVPDEVLAKIEVGVTTESELLWLAGKPNMVMENSLGRRIIYNYVNVESSPLVAIPFVGLGAVATGNATRTKGRMITFVIKGGVVMDIERMDQESGAQSSGALFLGGM